jgi:hypothetical protein
MKVDLLPLHGPIVSGVGIAGHDHWSSTIGTLVPATSGALIIVLLCSPAMPYAFSVFQFLQL